jgi:hypothetical protein
MQRKSGIAHCRLGFSVHFFALALALAFAFGFGFTSFMGTPQQIRSQATQLQFLSTVTTTPHFSHAYFSPFRAILSPPQLVSLIQRHRLQIKKLCNPMKLKQKSDN